MSGASRGSRRGAVRERDGALSDARGESGRGHRSVGMRGARDELSSLLLDRLDQDQDCNNEIESEDISMDERQADIRSANRGRRYLLNPQGDGAATIRAVQREGGVYMKRRPNGRVDLHFVLPKILKSDIRRRYPQIFCNVENSCDPDMILGFLTTFSSKNAVVHHICVDPGAIDGSRAKPRAGLRLPDEAESGVRKFSVCGVEQAARLWYGMRELMPDKTCHLLDAQVTARSDGSGVVDCMLELCGTVVVHRDQPPPWQRIRHHYGAFLEGVLRHSEATASPPANQVTTTLVKMTTLARMKMHLDSHKAIFLVEFEKSPPVVGLQYV